MHMPSWWPDYEESCLLFEPSPIVFAYFSNLALCKSNSGLLFSIDVAEHCFYDLLLFFINALIGGSVDYGPIFEGDNTPTELGVLLLLRRSMHTFFCLCRIIFHLTGFSV